MNCSWCSTKNCSFWFSLNIGESPKDFRLGKDKIWSFHYGKKSFWRPEKEGIEEGERRERISVRKKAVDTVQIRADGLDQK